ncbi:MAG: hypothetical protein DYG94_09395 [Leptolyngbya sp. PLA3]|nr:MAG: hypothetical protein EDM82_11935 [Cyanobacteria bacterium CYA]MCE7968945.1 hypothetical protein [Leptolyngbya sp. PL-A3]
MLHSRLALSGFHVVSLGARLFLCLVLCLGLTLPLSGCVDSAHLAALRERAVAVRSELATEVERLETDAQVQSDPVLAEASGQAAIALAARLAELDQAIAALDRVLAAEHSPDAVIQQVASEAVPLLPEPLRSPALLVGALLAAVFRASQLKRAAGSIAVSIAKASEKDEQFRSAIQRHADTLRSVQTSTAKRIVDEKLHEGFMLRLPV